MTERQIAVRTVGRLVAEKGYPELFQAARELGDPYVFLVIGPNDPEKGDALTADSVVDAAANGVRFLGMRTDVERLYSARDIFASFTQGGIPSRRDGSCGNGAADRRH